MSNFNNWPNGDKNILLKIVLSLTNIRMNLNPGMIDIKKFFKKEKFMENLNGKQDLQNKMQVFLIISFKLGNLVFV